MNTKHRSIHLQYANYVYVLRPMQLALVVDLFYLGYLTLNVAICSVCLHFSSFCLSFSSVADFSNTEASDPTSAGCAPFFTHAKSDAVYVCGLSVGHGYLSMAVFILIYIYIYIYEDHSIDKVNFTLGHSNRFVFGFGWVSQFNINHCDLFNAKDILVEKNSNDTI